MVSHASKRSVLHTAATKPSRRPNEIGTVMIIPAQTPAAKMRERTNMEGRLSTRREPFDAGDLPSASPMSPSTPGRKNATVPTDHLTAVGRILSFGNPTSVLRQGGTRAYSMKQRREPALASSTLVRPWASHESPAGNLSSEYRFALCSTNPASHQLNNAEEIAQRNESTMRRDRWCESGSSAQRETRLRPAPGFQRSGSEVRQ